MERRRRFPLVKTFVFCAVLGVALYLSRGYWLPAIASPLIQDQGPARADIIVVLAGDPTGLRIVKAAEFVREGYAPAALISGQDGYFGQYECDLAIAYAVRQGALPQWFIRFPNRAQSTREEAHAIIPELRRRGVKTALLVTTDFHTGRAGRFFRKAAEGSGIQIRVAAARDRFFQSSSWWRNREAQKTVLLEWCKTVTAFAGI